MRYFRSVLVNDNQYKNLTSFMSIFCVELNALWMYLTPAIVFVPYKKKVSKLFLFVSGFLAKFQSISGRLSERGRGEKG